MRSRDIACLLGELAAMPDQFETTLNRFPEKHLNWIPTSWEGSPGETFSALETASHLRDIEVDGYHHRFYRLVNEDHPNLVSIDGYELAEKRKYQQQNIVDVLSQFRKARVETVRLIKSFDTTAFNQTAFFEGYGEVTLANLIYFLRSHDLQHLACLNWLLGKMEVRYRTCL